MFGSASRKERSSADALSSGSRDSIYRIDRVRREESYRGRREKDLRNKLVRENEIERNDSGIDVLGKRLHDKRQAVLGISLDKHLTAID